MRPLENYTRQTSENNFVIEKSIGVYIGIVPIFSRNYHTCKELCIGLPTGETYGQEKQSTTQVMHTWTRDLSSSSYIGQKQDMHIVCYITSSEWSTSDLLTLSFSIFAFSGSLVSNHFCILTVFLFWESTRAVNKRCDFEDKEDGINRILCKSLPCDCRIPFVKVQN